MNHLLVCDGCQRHVRAREALCPFCGGALPMSLRRRRPLLPKSRLGRAATIAFGAAIATTGCGDDMGRDDAGNGTTDAGDGTTDAGDGTMDAGGDSDAGADSDAGGDTDGGALDGGASDGGALDAGSIDAGFDAGTGVIPLYGGPPRLDGAISRPDAGGDAGGGITPLYGSPGMPSD